MAERLITPWGENLPEIPWNIYPRPQLKRDSFFCLNGKWDFRSGEGEWEQIMVPFPPESFLSGIGRDMGKRPKLIYRKKFSLPDDFCRERTILHFGAVDQIARVSLNGISLGEHRGGYEAFSFEVTDALQAENQLTVEVEDHLEYVVLPYGKQSLKRGGMWYTPISGIWQTVWLESVPKEYIQNISVKTGLDYAEISVEGIANGVVECEGKPVPLEKGSARLEFSAPHHWSPDDPYLYHFTLLAGEDRVESYFALRTLEIREADGFARLCLNGKPIFFHALLDQGYFPDGIFTPGSPSGYENDILAMKKLGFNTLRKHIKVEPQQFYYDCDRLGMLVFQDMVNNGRYSFLRDTALPTIGWKKRSDRRMHRDFSTRQAFLAGMESTVKQLRNHPCIVLWTIFNEGWGQFDGTAAYHNLRELDDSRFIDTASGWFAGPESDVESPHIYFKPVKIVPGKKPVLLSEFGGYVYQDPEHSFNREKTYGYKLFERQEDYMDALEKLYREEIIPAVSKGLCGAVYTQLSDVEDETNGLLTYDRRVCKVDEVRMRALAEELYR